MRKLLIFTIFFLFLIPVPKTEANHVCGQDCNQYTEQGACTHGCYAGGAANPDYRREEEYHDTTQQWTDTYNQIKQQEQDAANLAERQRIANETAAAAQAAADAEATATAATRVRMAAEAVAAEAAAAEAQTRLQRAEELIRIQAKNDESLIASKSCMACVNCPDDHLHPWCAQIPGGHNPLASPKPNGETQTLFTYDPNNPNALADEVQRIKIYNQSINKPENGSYAYTVNAIGATVYFVPTASGGYTTSDTPNPTPVTDCSLKTGEELKTCLVNMAQNASYFVGACTSASACTLQSGWFYQVCTCPGGLSQDPNIKGQCRMNCQRYSSLSSNFLGGCAGQIDVCSDNTCAAGAGLKGFIISAGTSSCVPPPAPAPAQASSSTPPSQPPSVFDTPTPTPTTPPGGTTPTPTPTPPPGSSFQCQQIQILRGGVVIAPSQILLNDSIVFRGFASATNTTVSSMLFTVTINGVAQTPVSRPATLVGGQYQADYPYTISQATSYSASVTPVSP